MTKDPYNAFLPGDETRISGGNDGPLAGRTFAVKDVFDIAGYRTGNGQPTWRETHSVPIRHAAAVERLLGAGAELVGKTVCDEMCYSLAGDNAHYGAPVNPASPDRSVGGSSSGSASAVAGGLADFALGTDCGGSVRCPASFSGIYGIRPTHGRIDATGVVPLADSFDVVGWFSRDPGLFASVGSVLLEGEPTPLTPHRAFIAEDAFARLPNGEEEAARGAATRMISELFSDSTSIVLSEEGLDLWFDAFRHLQALEIWGTHRDWIEKHDPDLGPGVKDRFAYASTLTEEHREKWQPLRDLVRSRLYSLLKGNDTVIVLPTAPTSPLRNASAEEVDTFRSRTMGLTCSAGLSGFPQVSLPIAIHDAPLGISMIGPAGSDETLLRLAGAHGRAKSV